MAKRISNSRLLLLQHALPDTIEFVHLLSYSGAAIHRFLAKPFSIDANSYSKISKICSSEVADYSKFDDTEYLISLLHSAEIESQKDNRPIVILEVGGYFAKHLQTIDTSAFPHLRGVVEVTTFGHNRYLEAVKDLPIPVYSVARSPIKNIEARYVGRAAVVAIDSIFRELGVSLAGRSAAILGFGMIGSSVAEALRDNKVSVSIYDKAGFPRLDAFTRGYSVESSKDILLSRADLIVAATAQRSMSFEDIEHCKDSAVLVSAGSRGNEFDVNSLEERCIDKKQLSNHLCRYNISAKKKVYLVRNGTAVNFLVKSCPDEIVDLIHAEVLVCLDVILNDQRRRTRLDQVNELPLEDLHSISKDWLRHMQ